MRSRRVGWAFLSPTLIILFITGVLPFLYFIYIGFFDWNVFSARAGMVFAGVNNYRRLVFDQDFLAALGRTLLFAFYAVGIEFILGYFLAQTLVKPFRGRAFFRTIHALPLMVAPIAVGATWRLLTIPGFGPVPYFLDKWFGINYNIGRFAHDAFLTVVLMDIWHWTPFVTLVLLAGLTSMPAEPFEQAKVDGANRWQMFYYITIPMLMPIVLTAFFIRMMDALRVVDEIWMLTGGGPGAATRTVGIHIWQIVFPKTDYGYGSAMSLLVLYFTIVLSWLVYTAITSRREEIRQ
jgi:multiple sugar transport system permease protein